MGGMHALVADPLAAGGFRLADVPAPEPSDSEALVEVVSASLNPTDLHRARHAAPGTVLGYDAAGTVVKAAADGSGPAAGARVTGLGMNGTWAEFAAMPTSQLAVVPDGMDMEAAATLPLAGVSALRALRAVGPVLGRRLLVTGATGAVGAFAVQLAAVAGASEVLAAARNAAALPRLRELGATVAVDRLTAELGLVHGVVDNVGGPVLAQAFGLTAAGGTVVSVGRASGQDTVFAADDLMGDWGRSGRTVRTFFLPEEGAELGSDISFLLGLTDQGRLHPSVDHREDLRGELAVLRSGERRGKVVLRIHAP